MASIISAGTTSGTSLNLSGDTSGVLQLASNGSTTAVTIDTSQNVGIGTASPQSSLQVSGVISSAPTGTGVHLGIQASYALIQLNGGAAAGSVVDFSQSGSDYLGRILYDNTSNYMFFATNTAERMRIDSSGRVLVGLTSANTSGANFQVSQGVTFPATQSASSDANTLDDYEEGTWTPTLVGSSTAGTYTFSTNYSYYTKIGNQVTVNAYLVLGTASGGSGSAKFGGLPFSKSANQIFTGSVGASGVDFGANVTSLTVTSWTLSSSTEFYISETNDNAVESGLNISGISSTDVIFFSITYFV